MNDKGSIGSGNAVFKIDVNASTAATRKQMSREEQRVAWTRGQHRFPRHKTIRPAITKIRMMPIGSNNECFNMSHGPIAFDPDYKDGTLPSRGILTRCPDNISNDGNPC